MPPLPANSALRGRTVAPLATPAAPAATPHSRHAILVSVEYKVSNHDSLKCLFSVISTSATRAHPCTIRLCPFYQRPTICSLTNPEAHVRPHGTTDDAFSPQTQPTLLQHVIASRLELTSFSQTSPAAVAPQPASTTLSSKPKRASDQLSAKAKTTNPSPRR